MVETFGNYANLMTAVLGCDLARFFYDGKSHLADPGQHVPPKTLRRWGKVIRWMSEMANAQLCAQHALCRVHRPAPIR